MPGVRMKNRLNIREVIECKAEFQHQGIYTTTTTTCVTVRESQNQGRNPVDRIPTHSRPRKEFNLLLNTILLLRSPFLEL